METTSLSDIVNLDVLELENTPEEKNQGLAGQANFEENANDQSALNISDSQWINSSLSAYINSFNYNTTYSYNNGSVGDNRHQSGLSKYYVPVPSRGHSVFGTSRTSSSNIRSHGFRRTRSLTTNRARERG